MNSVFLVVALVIVLYGGYNLFIKISSDAAADTATSLVLATIALQVSALLVSVLFAVTLFVKGGERFAIGSLAYRWAIAAGCCIGAAEIAYFYVFRGLRGASGLTAGVAIPMVVAGTIAVSTVASIWLFRESLVSFQWIGILLIGFGVLLLVTNTH